MTTSLPLILLIIHPVQTLLLTIYFLADNIFFKVVFFFGIVRSILQAIALIILHVKFSLLSSVSLSCFPAHGNLFSLMISMKLRGHLSILMWIKVSTLYKRNQNTFTDSEFNFFLQHLSKKYV